MELHEEEGKILMVAGEGRWMVGVVGSMCWRRKGCVGDGWGGERDEKKERIMMVGISLD